MGSVCAELAGGISLSLRVSFDNPMVMLGMKGTPKEFFSDVSLSLQSGGFAYQFWSMDI